MRRRCSREYAHAQGRQDQAADPDRGHRREAPEASHRVRRHAPAVSMFRAAGLGSTPISSARSGSTAAESSSTKASIPRSVPRSKGAIVSPLRTKAVDIGGCIAVSSDPIATRRSLFADVPKPTVICRSSQAKERVEWQADFYASCLLMPRRLVHAEWQDRLGRTKPLLLSDLRPNEKVMLRGGTLEFTNRAEAKSMQWTTHFSRAWRSRSHAGSASHARPCASDWKSLGCCFERNRSNRPLQGHPVTFFEESVKCQLDER